MIYAGVDIESISLKGYAGTIWMLSICIPGKLDRVWHDCNGMKKCPPEARAILEDDSICKVIQSSEFDLPYMELQWGFRIHNIADTRLQEQVIQGLNVPRWNKKAEMPPYLKKFYAKHSSSLRYMLPRYGLPEADKSIRINFVDRPKGVPFTKKEIDYSGYDARCIVPIRAAQEYILTRDKLWEVALLENKTAEKVSVMKVMGLGFDKAKWRKITLDNEYRATQLLRKLPNKVHNWNSPSQVKNYFNSIGVLLRSFDDIDAALRKTNNSTLRLFVEWRDLMTQISKYGLSWLGPEFVDADGRIRCQWEQILNTGRFSVSNPPIHGLKKEGEHRAAFVPAKGKKYVIGDYTGQELGIMAAAAKERIWIDALLRNDDVHSLTASIVFKDQWIKTREKGCTFPKKCKCKHHVVFRHNAKTINYMLAYGGGIEKFMASTGHDKLTAAGILGRHSRAIPSVIRWLDRNGQEALKTGVAYSADPYRRRRNLRAEEDWRIINQGKNTPVQSAGANMVKLAMISMPEKYPIVFVWHDEIILEVPTKEAKKAAKVMKEVMNRTADYITGIAGLITVKPRIANNLMKD